MKLNSSSLMERRKVNLNGLQRSIKSISVVQKKINVTLKINEKKLFSSENDLKVYHKHSGSQPKLDDQFGLKNNHSQTHQTHSEVPPSSDDDAHQKHQFQEKYQFEDKLGEGAHGVVRKCTNKQNGRFYAVKTLQMEDQQFRSLKSNFIQIKKLKHKSIIKYKALYINPKKRICNIVMEYCPQSSMKAGLTEQQLRKSFYQLFDALSYLHKKHICHRDIKPDNILINKQTCDIKIIDFGVSKNLKRRGRYEEMLTNTGTYYYKAPEMFSGAGYTEAVDSWAAGISLYEMVTGTTPFESVYHSETIENICKQPLNLNLPEFQKFNPLVKDLISRLLRRNPKERLSCLQAKKHLWFFSDISNFQMSQSASYSKREPKEVDKVELSSFLVKRKPTINKEQVTTEDKQVMKTWLQIINQDARSFHSQHVSIDFVDSQGEDQFEFKLPSAPLVSNYLKVKKSDETRPKHKSIYN